MVGLGALAIWVMRKYFGGVQTDLSVHVKEQNALQQIGGTASTASQLASTQQPLSTLGKLPLAGAIVSPISDSLNGFLQSTGALLKGGWEKLSTGAQQGAATSLPASPDGRLSPGAGEVYTGVQGLPHLDNAGNIAWN